MFGGKTICQEIIINSKLISRFHQFCMQNELRLFPSLSDKPKQREESYKRLWRDLYKYVRVYSVNSQIHSKLYQHMERLWPENSKEDNPVVLAAQQQEQGIAVKSKETGGPHTLYKNLKKNEGSSDTWQQLEQAKNVRFFSSVSF